MAGARLAQSAEGKTLNLVVVRSSHAVDVLRVGAPASLPLGAPTLQLRGDNAIYHINKPKPHARHGETRALKSRGAFDSAELLLRDLRALSAFLFVAASVCWLRAMRCV